jgi:Transposase
MPPSRFHQDRFRAALLPAPSPKPVLPTRTSSPSGRTPTLTYPSLSKRRPNTPGWGTRLLVLTQDLRSGQVPVPACAARFTGLLERGVESVALESTGVYWIPVHEVLEGRGLEVVLVDTRALAQAPGRTKTDRRDCEWIQSLHSCGLLRGAFRPPDQICMLRTLVRDKGNLLAEQGDWVRRMQKSLEQMNVRVHRAVAELTGATGMALVRAIVRGERDPRQLAKLRDPRCQKSEEEIAEQLTGHWREDHLFSLRQALKMYEAIQERIQDYERAILDKLKEMEREEYQGKEAPELKNKQKAKALPSADRNRSTKRCTERLSRGRSTRWKVFTRHS